MTKKQIKIYEFVKKFALEHNYMPSYDEIIKKSGIYKSKQSIHEAMVALQDNGYIKFTPSKGKGRSYTIKGIKMVEVE